MTQETEWLKKLDAAALLDRGARMVLEYGRKGLIESRMERDPVTHLKTMYFSRASLEAFKAQKKYQLTLTTIEPKEPKLAKTAVAGRLLAQQAPPVPNAGYWLTLDEAAAESRLPRDLLLAQIANGRLPALHGEPVRREGEARARVGSGWRVHREELLALRGVPVSEENAKYAGYSEVK